jgi:hypothetical protein
MACKSCRVPISYYAFYVLFLSNIDLKYQQGAFLNILSKYVEKKAQNIKLLYGSLQKTSIPESQIYYQHRICLKLIIPVRNLQKKAKKP